MILQLSPHIPISTPKGEGIAHFLIDYGCEDDLYWVCFINETGECWTFSNRDIRALKNITHSRKLDDKIKHATLSELTERIDRVAGCHNMYQFNEKD